MSKGTQSSRHTQNVFAAIAMVALLFAAVSLAAGQDPQRKFKPGEMVDFGGGQSVEIVSCEGEGFEEDCMVRFYKDGTPGNRMRFSGRNIRAGEARFKAEKELAAAKERAKARQQNDNGNQGPADPRDPQRKFKPGEMVDFGGGQSVEIISCEGEGFEEDCMVRFYKDGTPGNRMRFSGRNIRAGEARLKAEKEREGAKDRTKARQDGNAGDNKTPTPTPRDTTATPPQPKPQTQTAGCNYEPPAPQHSNSATFSESLAKRELYDTTYGWAANGTGQAPVRVGVVFLTFQSLKPYQNIVRVTPGRGAQRLNDAAPPNTMIYPVKSTHIVCEENRDGSVKRRRVEGEYDCYKNKEGEWVCTSSGKIPPKVTHLN